MYPKTRKAVPTKSPALILQQETFKRIAMAALQIYHERYDTEGCDTLQTVEDLK